MQNETQFSHTPHSSSSQFSLDCDNLTLILTRADEDTSEALEIISLEGS